jgi:hypothetical protein
MREMAENYGREAAKMTVVRTVDCERRKAKRRAISRRLTGHPWLRTRPCVQREIDNLRELLQRSFYPSDKRWSQSLSVGKIP